MRALEEYLFDLDAAPDESLSGEGLVVLTLAAATSGTCGVTTPEAGLSLPVPVPAATGEALPAGSCTLPLGTVTGAQASWRPAWGEPSLALPQVAGVGSFPLGLDLVLTPLFFLGQAGASGQAALPMFDLETVSGAAADCAWPLPAPYGLSGLNRRGNAACALRAPSISGWACGLENPTQGSLDSPAVVALLCQGESDLGLIAAALAQGATLASAGADGLTGILLGAVAENLTYVADSDDLWSCALGTYARGSGDCEDGAILLHALLLAAGITADRLVTVFGRVGIDQQGHAWLSYRRESDGNWVALDWTSGSANTAITAMTPLVDRPYYATVDYALTAQTFFAVRQSVATFFARVSAENLDLPLPELDGTASLGLAGVATLPTSWLRVTARGAGQGHTTLPGPDLTARAGLTALAAVLPSPTLTGRTGPTAGADLTKAAVAGLAQGGAGRAALATPKPVLASQAIQDFRGRGACTLSRTRLRAQGLDGACATGRSVWPGARIAGLAWPGPLAGLGATLPDLALAATGLGTDPGYGLGELPPWAGQATGVSPDAFAALAPWNTANPEVW